MSFNSSRPSVAAGKMDLYYCFPLTLHFNSGQTLQVIQDYVALAQHGYTIHLYGTYEDETGFQELLGAIKDHPVHLSYRKGNSKWNRNLLKCLQLAAICCNRNPKILVSRNVNKMAEILALRWAMGPATCVWERHEDAIPYLLERADASKKTTQKHQMQRLLSKTDGLVLTNASQEELFKQEFASLPLYSILPNGVDQRLFSQAYPERNTDQITLTYTGQFTRWKNVELLFQALAYLPKNYRLRLAGGKGDGSSNHWVNTMVAHYGLEGRVDYLGFIPPANLVVQAVQGSAALLLPLGNNMESRYFTSPMKLVEAMATRIPVVAVDFPSVRGLAGTDTVYLAPNEPEQFAAAIQQAMSDPEQGDRIDRMNLRAKHYTHQARAEKYHAFLKELASQ